MILKTLAFIFLLYLLVKFISRLFLSAPRKRNSAARIIFQTYKNIRQQQEKQRRAQQPKKQYFEEVEEAEFEDITEEPSKSQSS